MNKIILIIFLTLSASNLLAFTLDKVVPNPFTPNGDGINDKVYFYISNPSSETINGYVTIWGEDYGVPIYFAKEGENLYWDGNVGISPIGSGEYHYSIYSSIPSQAYSGTIYLVKNALDIQVDHYMVNVPSPEHNYDSINKDLSIYIRALNINNHYVFLISNEYTATDPIYEGIIFPTTLTLATVKADDENAIIPGILDIDSVALGSGTVNMSQIYNRIDSIKIKVIDNMGHTGISKPIDTQNVIVFPNPYNKETEYYKYISFTNLNRWKELKIYDISGERIFHTNDDVNNPHIWYNWDMKNDLGESVASGVYIYVITNNTDEKKTGKLAIIK